MPTILRQIPLSDIPKTWQKQIGDVPKVDVFLRPSQREKKVSFQKMTPETREKYLQLLDTVQQKSKNSKMTEDELDQLLSSL